eukprot:3194010-Amphidinium_carterae.2
MPLQHTHRVHGLFRSFLPAQFLHHFICRCCAVDDEVHGSESPGFCLELGNLGDSWPLIDPSLFPLKHTQGDTRATSSRCHNRVR